MARAYPPDVIVLDTDGLLHARIASGRKNPRIETASTYSLAEGAFKTAVVTPELINEEPLTHVLTKAKADAGRLDRVTLLLPDSWFRVNLIDLPSLPDRADEALHAVHWSLKRTLPIPPETLRVRWQIVGRTQAGLKLLVFSIVEVTVSALERVFAAAGVDVAVIEQVGLNIWNAITVREQQTTNDRLFLYIRDNDFTTAVFRGSQPLFIRSRNLSGERTLQQEIRLSANYVRETLQMESLERTYIAGRGAGGQVQAALASEFSAPVVPVALSDFVDDPPAHLPNLDAELTACTGVFTA